MRHRYYVKIVLELHAVTCPGVWLCTSGYLELTVKCLGYFFKSGPVEPKFPMLCHDVFTMEGYFPAVRSFNDLDKVLATEHIDISLWQNSCRLAYFNGRIKQIICNTYGENSSIQILMNPSHNFPGIIAPKLELMTHLYFDNRSHFDGAQSQHTCRKFVQSLESSDNYVPNKTIQSQPDERDPQARIQRPVCHTKLNGYCKLEKTIPDWRIPDSCRKCKTFYTDCKNDKIDERRQSRDTIPSLKFSCSSRNSMSRVGSNSPRSEHSENTQRSNKSGCRNSENCDICSTYDRTFRVS